jgi:tellurite resistance-related uncharacterized protein
VNRAVVAFEPDDAGDWIASLACGHRRHVRHEPPFSECAWVESAEGRAARVGTGLDCRRCDQRVMPKSHAPYQRTPDFDAESVPAALRRRHTTKAGVWALIHVTRGALDYHVHEPFERHEVLTPEAPGVVLPEVEHHVAPTGDVSFYVEFWRKTE